MTPPAHLVQVVLHDPEKIKIIFRFEKANQQILILICFQVDPIAHLIGHRIAAKKICHHFFSVFTFKPQEVINLQYKSVADPNANATALLQNLTLSPATPGGPCKPAAP